jgi:hypothetical protein
MIAKLLTKIFHGFKNNNNSTDLKQNNSSIKTYPIKEEIKTYQVYYHIRRTKMNMVCSNNKLLMNHNLYQNVERRVNV